MKILLNYGLYILIFLSALHVVIARHDTRRLFVELQQLERTNDQLNEEWGRLQLEQSTWAINDRIESLARTELDMKMPEQSSVVLLAK
ncbi:MAG: cell division protein FtsL [Proteobacteria bacterium]|nr:cell division protein FtsL [Pseudomonadota bacterium]NOG60083.1 cell division protein FtsL [Pseudomonadota bacterium]